MGKSSTNVSLADKWSLSDWQQGFTQSLLNDLSKPLQETFQLSSEQARQDRFSIYQNNVFYSLTTALGDLYPVIKKLVGDDFFTGTAAYYLRQHPPQQAAMVHLGQDFPDFLSHFEHTQTMPYLSAVAELELARHRAYHAMDQAPLLAANFATLTPEQLENAKLSIHPSAQFVESIYPIFSIWQMNQENSVEKDINLDEPQSVLVVRPYYEVTIFLINSGIYYFLDALNQHYTLAEAINKALKYGEFDISQAINFAIEQQLFTAVTCDGINLLESKHDV